MREYAVPADPQQPAWVVVATAPSAQAAGSYHGCPRGAFCIYPGTTFNGDNPEYVFFSYAGHNIYNEYGNHRVVSNQTANAAWGLCYGSRGTGGAYVGGVDERPQPETINLTVVNSVELRPNADYHKVCRR